MSINYWLIEPIWLNGGSLRTRRENGPLVWRASGTEKKKTAKDNTFGWFMLFRLTFTAQDILSSHTPQSQALFQLPAVDTTYQLWTHKRSGFLSANFTFTYSLSGHGTKGQLDNSDNSTKTTVWLMCRLLPLTTGRDSPTSGLSQGVDGFWPRGCMG